MTQELIEQPALDTHPMSIISRAVAQGVDPEQLSRLMDLQERYEKNEARKAYNRAMKACQEEMPVVVTDSENTHTRSRYASLEAVTKTIKPIYTRHGFSLSYGSDQSPTDGHILITCACMHEAGHTELFTLNCPYDTSGAQGKSNKTAIQGMGSSVAYGRRYLKLMIFDVNISDEDDDGGSVGTGVDRVNENQIAILQQWMSQLNADDQARFLTYMEADSLDRIHAAEFKKALDALQRKVKATACK